MPAPSAVASPREACTALGGRDLLSIRDLSRQELVGLMTLAVDVRREPAQYARALSGQTLATMFEKPSLRTRVSFHVAAQQLGGHALDLSPQDIGLDGREALGDVARTLERMVSGLMIRTFAHEIVEQLAAAASIPVINGLTDFSHPCQALDVCVASTQSEIGVLLAQGLGDALTARGVASPVAAVVSQVVVSRDDRAFMSTDVDGIYLHFARPAARRLGAMTVEKLHRYAEEGQFPPGTMGPKVEAALRFVTTTGGEAIVTSPDRLVAALEGGAGTHVTAGPSSIRRRTHGVRSGAPAA